MTDAAYTALISKTHIKSTIGIGYRTAPMQLCPSTDTASRLGSHFTHSVHHSYKQWARPVTIGMQNNGCKILNQQVLTLYVRYKLHCEMLHKPTRNSKH